MNRLLLLAGFTLHISIGGLCFAPIPALAQESSPVPTGVQAVMTPQAGVTCVSVQLMSIAGDDGSMQGGCADGHCLKQRTPAPLVTSSTAPDIQQPAALLASVTESMDTYGDCDTSLTYSESPPFPPGTDTVVMRE